MKIIKKKNLKNNNKIKASKINNNIENKNLDKIRDKLDLFPSEDIMKIRNSRMSKIINKSDLIEMNYMKKNEIFQNFEINSSKNSDLNQEECNFIMKIIRVII